MKSFSFSRFFSKSWRRMSNSNPRSRRHPWRTLGVEALEQRELLSANLPRILSVTPADGSRSPTSTPTIQITFDSPMVGVNGTGGANGTGVADKNNYVIVSASGTANPITVTSASVDTTTHETVTLSYQNSNGNNQLYVDTYTLFVKGDHLVDSTDGLPVSVPGQLVTANIGTGNLSLVNVSSDATLQSLSNIPQPSSGGASPTLAAPAAVALKDLNNPNDNIPDLVVANAGTNRVTIFQGRTLAQGGGFSTTPDLTLTLPGTTADSIKALVVTDINNDGLADIIVTDNKTNDLVVFINQTPKGGKLKFMALPAFTNVGPNPVGLVAGAFQGNNAAGLPDLAVLNGTATGGNYTVTILPNIAGTFGTPVTINLGAGNAALKNPTSIVADQFLGSGLVDLAVGGSNGVQILTNAGPVGTINFTAGAALQAANTAVTSLSSGHLEGGILPDLVAGTTGNQAFVLENQGAGAFLAAPSSVPSGTSGRVLVKNLTGGALDNVLITNAALPTAQSQLAILKPGSGTGQITSIAVGPGGVGAGVFIVTSPNHGLKTGDTVLISGVSGDAGFNGTFTITKLSNNDFQVSGATLTTGVYNFPTGSFARAGMVTGASSPAAPIVITSANHGLKTGDHVRIVGVLGNTAANGVWTITFIDAGHFSLNGSIANGAYLSGGTWTAVTGINTLAGGTYAVDYGPLSIATGDVNGDGNLDVVTANGFIPAGSTINTSGNDVSLLYGNGNATFRTATNVTTPNIQTPIQSVTGDLNGDGIPDIVSINSSPSSASSFVTVQLGLASGGYTTTDYSFPQTGPTPMSSFSSVALGDINGDGALDIIVSDGADSQVGFLINKLSVGQGFTAPYANLAVGSNPTQVIAVDLNKDGKADLVVPHFGATLGTQGVSVLQNLGGGKFGPIAEYLTGQVVTPVGVAADFNKDGNPDIAITDGNLGLVYVLHGDGLGGFSDGADPTPFSTGVILPNALVAADIDNDGFPDLLVSSASSSPSQGGIAILRNQVGSGFATSAPVAVQPGSPLQNLQVTDLNEDGALDIVVTAGATGATSGIADNLFALFGKGDGTFQKPIAYKTNGSTFVGNGPSFVAVVSNPMVRTTTFTAGGSIVKVDLVQNGTFSHTDLAGEQGNLAGWQTFDLPDNTGGSRGRWGVQTGTQSPISSVPVLPADTIDQAMLDEADLVPVLPATLGGSFRDVNNFTNYSGTHALYQDFAIPVNAQQASLSLSLYAYSFASQGGVLPGNVNGTPAATPYSNTNLQPLLDYRTADFNQQVRIDLMDPNSPTFNILGVTSGQGVLQNLFVTNPTSGIDPNDPANPGQFKQAFTNIDVSAYKGQTIRLRIASTNNHGKLLVGVTDVSLVTTFSDTVPPTLSNVKLRNPGFVINGVPHTTDPTIVGQIGDNTGVANIAFVEIDPNNAGFVSGTDPKITPFSANSSIDAVGNFTVTIPNALLTPGQHTVGVRVVDKVGNQTTTTFTFVFQGATTTEFQSTGPGATDVRRQIAYDNPDPTQAGQFLPVDYKTVSGRITSIVVDPTDATGNTYYVGSANGGVWKTTDGGASWAPETDAVVDGAGKSVAIAVPVGALGISKTNPSVVYAGLGVADLAFDSRPGFGVLKTIDAGKTWTLIGTSATTFFGARISKIVVDNNTPDVVYVAVASGGAFGPGVYKSTDGGLTWANVLLPQNMFRANNGGALGAGTPLASVTDLIIDPFDANRLLVGLGNIGLLGAPNATAGVWRTVNNGGTWDQIVGGDNPAVQNGTLPTGTSVGKVLLGIGNGRVGDEKYVYVLMGKPPVSTAAPNLNYGGMLGLFKTKDNLLNFTKVMLRQNVSQNYLVGAYTFEDINLFAQDGANSGAIAVDPVNPNVVYIGGSRQYTDRAANLDNASRPNGTAPELDHALIRIDTGDMVDTTYVSRGIILNNGDDQFKDFYGRNGKYTNGQTYIGEGVYWYDLEENHSGAFGNQRLLPEQVHALTFDPRGRLLIGMNGGIWRGVSNFSYGYDYTSGEDIFGIGNIGGILPDLFPPFFPDFTFGTASPTTLTAINGNLQIADLTSVAIDPVNPNILYTTQTDTGSARSSRLLSYTSSGLTGTNLENNNNPGLSQSLGEFNAGFVFAATPTPGALPGTPTTLFRVWQNFRDPNAILPEISTDNGVTFVARPRAGINQSNNPTGFFPAVALNPTKIFDSGIYEDELLYGTNRVFLTRTTSNVFDPISNKLTNSLISALGIAASKEGVYYAGTYAGEVFVTQNAGGDGWPLRNGGLPAAPVNAIGVDPTDPMHAYVAFGGGPGISHLWVTYNGGLNWTNVSAGLPNTNVYSVVVDPHATLAAPRGKVFVGTDVGVYRGIVQPDNSVAYTLLGAGLPNAPAVNLQYNASQQKLAIALQGRGVYTIAVNDTGPRVASITQPAVGQASVTIAFSEAIQPSTFTLSQVQLLDPKGKTVKVTGIVNLDTNLNNQFQITFDGSTAAGGAYTVKVGPGIVDNDGNGMDQNGNGVQGENPGDIFTGRFMFLPTPNHAPSLGVSAVNVPTILENAFTNNGFDLPTLIAGLNITDVDPNALKGIAITSVDNSNGQWQFSLDGGTTWTNFGAVSTTSARLLGNDPTERIRFIPNQDFFSSPILSGFTPPTFNFLAWDLTSGLTPANGGDGGTADASFTGGSSAFSANSATATLQVINVNQVPIFAKGPNQSVLENAVAQTVLGWAFNISPGPNEAYQQVNFIVTTDNPTLFATTGQPAVSPIGDLTFQPATNQFGTAIVTVMLHDNGGTANGGVDTSAAQTFVITVTHVNQPPTFTPGPTQVLQPSNNPQQILTQWATNIAAGPPNESDQQVVFLVGAPDNPALFTQQPTVDSTGVLRYTVAPNVIGVSHVTVRLHDNGGTANGGIDTSAPVTLTFAVFHPPTLLPVADQSISHNALPINIQLFANDIDGNLLTYGSTALGFSRAYDAEQLLSLRLDPLARPANPYYFNAIGLQEKWLQSTTSNLTHGGYYVVLPNGEVRPWLGGRATGAVAATVDVADYNTPTNITTATTAPPAPTGVTAMVTAGGLLTINAPAGYIGTFKVAATVSDGFTTLTDLIKVTITDNAPVLPPIADQKLAYKGFPIQVALNGTDADTADTISYTPTALGYSAAFDLEQQLALQRDPLAPVGNPYYFNGLGLNQQDKWLRSTNGSNAGHQGYYVVLPDGEVRPWLGGASTGATVGTVDVAAYADPTLITNAVAPVPPAGVNLSVANGILTIAPPAGFTGTFRVNVTVSDGILSSKQSFLVTSVNTAPQLAQIADQSVSTSALPLSITLSAADAENDALTFNSSVAGFSAAFDLGQKLSLKKDPIAPTTNPYYFNAIGLQEKWLISSTSTLATGGYFVVLPDGDVRPWLGGRRTGQSVGKVEVAAYTDPSLFFGAAPTAPAGVTAVVSNGVLTIGAPAGFAGKFRVNVSASDGANTTAESFVLTAVNDATQPGTLGDRQLLHNQFPLQVPLNATDSGGNPLTYNPTVAGYSGAFDIEQQLGLKVDPLDTKSTFYFNALGLQEKWLISPTANQSNKGYFVILPDGEVRPWLGGVSTGATVGKVDVSAYTDPSLIFNAVAPTAPAGVTAIVAGGKLTVNAPSTFVGTFRINLAVTDQGVTTNESFLVTSVNTAPQLVPIADQSRRYNQFPLQLPVRATDGEADALTLGASVAGFSVAFDVKQQLALRVDPLDVGQKFYFNALGLQEKWLQSTTSNLAHGGYYVILPDGDVRPWLGGNGTGPSAAKVDAASYANPLLIANATAPTAPAGVSASVVAGTLNVTTPAGFTGKFRVNLTANDGVNTGTTSFLVTSINDAPALAPIADQTLPTSALPLQLAVSAPDADGDVVTFPTSVSGVSAAFDLEQQLSLAFTGNFYQNALGAGLQEKWLRSSTTNLSNGGWYVILQDGEVRAWLGGSSTGPTLATLGAAVYADPSLLYNAPAPTAPAGISTSVNNGILTIGAPAGFTGKFRVNLSAFDGVNTTSESFVVTVY